MYLNRYAMYTENNHSSMKTVVETFIIEETSALIYDNEKLDKWNQLVAEMGLNGQTKIAAPEKSPIPFLHMKQSIANVFTTLCPVKVEVQEYNLTPIPLEILELIALSQREEYFQKIEIWYDDKDPDPACVGLTGHWYELEYYRDSVKHLKGMKFNTKQAAKEAGAKYPHFVETAKYLIGKWADVKQSFAELKEMAKARFIEEKGVELRLKIREAQRKLDDLETDAAAYVAGNSSAGNLPF